MIDIKFFDLILGILIEEPSKLLPVIHMPLKSIPDTDLTMQLQ